MKPTISLRIFGRITMGYILSSLFMLLMVVVLALQLKEAPPDAGLTCASFGSREEAQKALRNNPRLDGDGDGIACDTLK